MKARTKALFKTCLFTHVTAVNLRSLIRGGEKPQIAFYNRKLSIRNLGDGHNSYHVLNLSVHKCQFHCRKFCAITMSMSLGEN
jgi:hypothetical protein